MQDLIERSDAIKAMEQRYQDILRIFKRKVKDGEKAIALDMIGCIKSLPSTDRPQGEWTTEYHGNGWNDYWDYTCSNCCKKYERADAVLYKANFCPNCGAEMRKGVDDD